MSSARLPTVDGMEETGGGAQASSAHRLVHNRLWTTTGLQTGRWGPLV